MVLAAGLGVRMRPLTDKMPKPLVRVAGQPLLDHVLDKLAGAGVSEAVVNVHYLPDQIIEHTRLRKKPRVIISDERNQVLGTGGAVVKALPILGDAPFFHLNADTMWIDGVRPNLARLAEAFDPARMDIMLLMAPTASSIGIGAWAESTARSLKIRITLPTSTCCSARAHKSNSASSSAAGPFSTGKTASRMACGNSRSRARIASSAFCTDDEM